MLRRSLPTVAALVALAAALAFALRMHEGVVLSNDVKSRCWPWAPSYGPGDLSTQYLSDPVWQFAPWIELARRELLEGRLPLWNPHQDGGVPLLGNAQSALGSPLLWPALLLGVRRGWNAMLLLKALAATCGAFLWLRGRGRSPSAAALGGAMFGLSGAFLAWLEHPHTLAAAAVPFTLLFAERLRERFTRGALFGLALSSYAVLAGGHPETALMAAMVGAVLVLAAPLAMPAGDEEAARAGIPDSGHDARTGSGLPRIALGGALGALLAAPLLLPFAEYYLLSAARHGVERHPFVQPVAALSRFLLPNAAGSHPIEAAATVSLAGLALAVLGVLLARRERETRACAVVTLAALALVYDNPLSRALAAATPVFWTRLLLLAPLPLAALASRALDLLRERAAAPQRRGRAATLVSWALVAAAAGELVWAARGTHGITAARDLAPRTPILERLLAEPEPFRVLPLHTFLPPNTATDYGLDDLRGYDALAPAGWRAARESIGRFGSVPTQTDVLEPWLLAPGGRALDSWNVTYLLLHPQFRYGAAELNARLGLALEEVHSGPDGKLLRNLRALPRVRWEGGGEASVVLAERLPTLWRVHVRAPSPGAVVVANPYYPGWWVFVDGTRQELALHPGEPISVSLAAGEHDVRLEYRPWTFRLGVALALLAAGVLAVLTWSPRSRTGRPALTA